MEPLIEVTDAARLLDVSVQHVRRLVAQGELAAAARGVLYRESVTAYVAQRESVRSRAWTESSAWAAIAELARCDVTWLGASQRSRIRAQLREVDAPSLASRLRNRAVVERFRAHSSTAPRLASDLVVPTVRDLGLVHVPVRITADGYVSEADAASLKEHYALDPDPNGWVVLRVTGFDIGIVQRIASESSLLGALDAAWSTDPRMRAAGLDLVQRRLADFQTGRAVTRARREALERTASRADAARAQAEERLSAQAKMAEQRVAAALQDVRRASAPSAHDQEPQRRAQVRLARITREAERRVASEQRRSARAAQRASEARRRWEIALRSEPDGVRSTDGDS